MNITKRTTLMHKYPGTPLKDLDLSRLETYPAHGRKSTVSVDRLGKPYSKGSSLAGFIDGMPDILAAKDTRDLAYLIARARKEKRGVLLAMGAHPIKVGISPVIIDAIESGIFTGIATNGAAIIHDFELALTGRTSEDVSAVLGSGQFGMAEETATTLNSAITEGSREDLGIGRSVGRHIAENEYSHSNASVFAAAFREGIPATVHVAIGTDIIHMHPSCSGAATGEASLADFHLFARQVAALDNGVFINLGSAVLLPEVFLKAYSLARNLGHKMTGLCTVNMDFIQHYRPRVNVVQRPTMESGKGYTITGHHEIMFPLLMAAVKELL
jgi:hypothetical protein